MINIDSLSMKAFVEENRDFFLGAKVQKIQQPNRRELILVLRNNGETRKFYININPSFYHVCFMNKENEKRRAITIPKAAAMFCMLLRKYIDASRIVDIVQPEGERIIELYFDFYDALNDKVKLCLAIELMGKHSNVILYNFDTNVIIGCAHNVGSEKSKERELAGLLPYIYPPKQKKYDINKIKYEKFVQLVESPESIEQMLASEFYYLTKPIVQNILADVDRTNLNVKQLFLVVQNYISLKNISPSICEKNNTFSLYNLNSDYKQFDSVNSMLDEYFASNQEAKLIENLKAKLNAIVDHQIKKLKALKNKQEYQLAQDEKASLYKKKGDLLMVNAYSIELNSQKIILNDYETSQDVSIDVDLSMSAIDNANRYYKLYKKIKSAQEHTQSMIQETNSQLQYFLEQKYYINISNTISDLKDIQNELLSNGDNSSLKKKEDSALHLEPIMLSGYRVFVGKNSKQNDFILSKIASSEDIWFHPLNMAGSHVILKKNSPKETVPDEVLFEAAKLSKDNSCVRLGSKVPIIYTLRKYVKKATSKGLAFVTYKNETEILVD